MNNLWSLIFFLFVAAIDGTKSKEQQQERRTKEKVLKVIGSVVFSVVIKDGIRDNISWETYESELVWAVDILALETLSVVENDWISLVSADPTEDAPVSSLEPSNRRKLQVHVDIPSSLGLSSGGSRQPCPPGVGDVELDRCEKVYAAIRLVLDNNRDDPIQVEESFEAIFNAAVLYGRLQTILVEFFPESFVQVYSERDVVKEAEDESSPPAAEAPAVGSYFDDDNIQTNAPQTTAPEPAASNDEVALGSKLSLGSLLAILTGVLVVFVGAGVAAFVLGHRRFSSLFSLNKEIPEIEPQETDLIENFSVAGLEWGSPEVLNDSDPPFFADKKKKPQIPLEELATSDAVVYKLPSSLKFPPQPSPMSDMTGPSHGGSSSGSVETPEYASGYSVVDGSGKAQSSPELSYLDLSVNLDGLEAAIVEGDWNTLAAAANAITEAGGTDESTQGKLSVVSREWTLRDKSWQDAIDATKAAELDHLIEEGDWAGIIEAAARYGSEKAEGA